ncbi:hypothetical protein MVLG_05219 [Microbotryum lychnidis-dioicae p1A1 Lamole]|uniref:Uncharacterized protein n=1 Tax=Microbotryum lychnidis-dioicae (strain p1A1 Lamole / MvSl-1064) TaxID=683840 RepID=U5HDK7_USTV1|nr:hypothetical protein MVLG_05219 [Microbotryum lychnidis-dioicae p1A1 Lamole]|eukprot:KDE04339.1 hypothetical protein MVLG_05219 [Microbotryum lychnidis-dioicae p1A1 Lamole]
MRREMAASLRVSETQVAAFAASDLLRDANGYQDWVLTLCSRLPFDVLEYLKSGVPHPSWPPSYVPLWDHYARASICAAVDPRMVLPGLSRYFGDAHSGHKIWVALRMRYGAVSAVDLLPVVARLFSPEPMPDTPDAFLQFRDRFENDSRLLADSNVTTDSLLASHLLARMPPSLSAWRTTFVNSQGTSGILPPAAELLDRIHREIKARPAEAPVVAVANPKQLLGLVSLVRRSEPYHRLSSRRILIRSRRLVLGTRRVLVAIVF